MTEGEAYDFLEGSTWGAEVDIGTADRKIALPEGNTWSPDEDSGVNAAGISIDPTLTYNCFGGELRTRPCGSPAELHKLILDIADLVIPGENRTLPPFPGVIHVHIRVPALLESPDVLRHLLVYGEKWDEKLQAALYKPFTYDPALCRGGVQHQHHEVNSRTMHVARTKGYQADAINRALLCESDDVKEIMKACNPGWRDPKNLVTRTHELFSTAHDAPMNRPCYNYGHLIDLETIEFRAFVATLDPVMLKNILEYPARYLRTALQDLDPMYLVQGTKYQAGPIWGTKDDPLYMRARRASTDLYVVDPWMAEEAVRLMLSLGEITLADLNYPQMFIDEGFQ